MAWSSFIDSQLQKRKDASAWRERRCIEKSSGRELHFQGKSYLNFSSNDYLGLSQHPEIIRAWQQGAQEYGVGSGGSGHITGFTHAHHQAEQKLADWLGYPRAILFISGFAANHALITALMTAEDRILADKLSHASLLEGAMHSQAQLRRFSHNSVNSLKKLISKPHTAKTLVVTEGVFSMDGDSAPLDELQTLAHAHNAWLMVDDAHGLGIWGKQGRGSCDEYGIKPDILVATFGKAVGVSGAAVLCDERTADFLIQAARHLIYSTSMPPAQAVAISAAVGEIQQADEQRAQLQRNIHYFKRQLNLPDMHLVDSNTAIQPLIVGDNEKSLQLSQFLREKGIWVQAIRPPTVPPGSARLRMTLSAAHQQDDIDKLLEALNEFVFVS
ncbi:8-amino-7-oxononanoate synthase [Providencia alcalifaciens]|uniref:8-amino-7-oxononanoate synthase n=1 Tax=Providencia alcalifaciens TaxID=126385 RepID=UPI0003E21BDB|nr:8-amino-7-oxononanoate synthase [Providencia alcalifaciens]ETT02080.1 8-amino-7-oxononanoate synthase [Providencia alcalifaciens PAL-3]EUC99626.1 8-amino-7-oxononanoate synthase [Providencia alcalifaciens PAL-1]